MRRPFQIHRLLGELCQHRTEIRFRPLYGANDPLIEGHARFHSSKLQGSHPWIEFSVITPCTGVSPPTAGDRVEVSFSSHLSEGFCRFQSDALAHPGEGHTLRLSLPRTVERFQRRVAVRIKPPEDRPLFVELGNDRSYAIRSLSVRGLGFICPAEASLTPGTMLKPLRVYDHGGKTLVERDASVKEVAVCEKDLRFVSVVFQGINLESEEVLRQYMLDTVQS